MKIELKNVKLNMTFSEEITCFKADVYVDGVKTAYAENDGHGGCTFYGAYPGKREQMLKAENYAKSLPDVKLDNFNIPSTLEFMIDTMIDDFVDKKEKDKFNKRMVKDMDTSILFGIPESGSYKTLSFKGKPKLSEVVKTSNGKTILSKEIEKIRKGLKDNEKILNTNLKNLGL